MQAGAPYGIAPFGARALDSMRHEKHFGSWAREFRPIYTATEAGLSPFVKLTKPDFIGREAAQAQSTTPKLRRICMSVEAQDADCIGDEPILLGDAAIGWVTSGGYGHSVHQSLAQGYIPAEQYEEAVAGGLTIEILGKHYAAHIQTLPPFDPTGGRMRLS
jgi:dimethylglycine dehydrogenase